MKQINLWVKDIFWIEMIDQATFYSVWAKFHRQHFKDLVSKCFKIRLEFSAMEINKWYMTRSVNMEKRHAPITKNKILHASCQLKMTV